MADMIARGLANAAKTKTDKITVTNNVDLDSINTKSSKITVVNDVDLDELVQLNANLTNNGQINGMQIKTQEEYDALPATKETDGVIYLIRG